MVYKWRLKWFGHKVFWISKDNSTGRSEKKRSRDRQEKGKEGTRMDFGGRITRAAESRFRWKRVVVNASMVPK